MHGILHVSNCSTKIRMEISWNFWFDVVFFSVRSEQFSEKHTPHRDSESKLWAQSLWHSSVIFFTEVFQKAFQMCNNTTAQTQRRAPTHRHGHGDLTRKHLLATQRIVVEISIARAARGCRNFVNLSYLIIWCPLPNFCTRSMPRGCSLLLSNKSSRVIAIAIAAPQVPIAIAAPQSQWCLTFRKTLLFFFQFSQIFHNISIPQGVSRHCKNKLYMWCKRGHILTLGMKLRDRNTSFTVTVYTFYILHIAFILIMGSRTL